MILGGRMIKVRLYTEEDIDEKSNKIKRERRN